VGDSIALGETLNLRCIFLSGPEWVHQRLREADALIELAGESQNAELALFGHRWRLVSMLELGETEAAERELEAYERVSDQARAGSARWYALTLHATRAFVEGRLEEAERLTLEAFAQRRREPTELTVYTFGVQLLWLRREQGRLSELAPYVRAHPLDSRIPMMAAFRATAALLDLETGSPEDAREQLARLAENDLADLPRDFTYLYGLAVLSELCAALGDPACAATLYDALRPFADRQVVLFMGTVYWALRSATWGSSQPPWGTGSAPRRTSRRRSEATSASGLASGSHTPSSTGPGCSSPAVEPMRPRGPRSCWVRAAPPPPSSASRAFWGRRRHWRASFEGRLPRPADRLGGRPSRAVQSLTDR